MRVALGRIDKNDWTLLDQLTSSQAGCVRFADAGGNVMSVQPDGTCEWRPAGTDGPYEQAKVSSGLALYNPVDRVAYVFGVRAV